MVRMFLLVIVVLVFGFSSPKAYALDDQEIAALIQTGVDEDDIIRMMESQGSDCVLTPDCIQKLRQAGASDKLIKRLLSLTKQ